MMSGWDDPQNALAYEKYAQTHPMYHKTSASLVQLADITQGLQVLDLCCGTGITSEAILAQLDGTGHLYAVDLAQAMLDVASEKLFPENDNYSVHQSPAEEVDSVTDAPLDRILCNSAFWQVDADTTLAAIHRTLAEDGKFVFNLPDTFYEIDSPQDSKQQHFTLIPKMRRIATEDYGFHFPQFKPRHESKGWKLTYEGILEKLVVAGFKLQQYEVIGYQQNMTATFDFFTIPIMTERILPDVDYDTRLEILKKATSEMNSNTSSTRHWAYFILHKM